ncbi:hypothetical protein ES708_20798 [subsurface metagenome]
MQHTEVHKQFPNHVETLKEMDKLHPHKLKPEHVSHFNSAHIEIGRAAQLYREVFELKNEQTNVVSHMSPEDKAQIPQQIKQKMNEIEEHLEAAKAKLEKIPADQRKEAQRFW